MGQRRIVINLFGFMNTCFSTVYDNDNHFNGFQYYRNTVLVSGWRVCRVSSSANGDKERIQLNAQSHNSSGCRPEYSER